MFALFTDFGDAGPYVGQMKAVLAAASPAAAVDLLHDAPRWDPLRSGYLLKYFTQALPSGCVCLVVVDPGVGTDRPGHVVHAVGKWFVGPGNGVFEYLLRADSHARLWELPPPSGDASATFHGRDYFSPAAASVHEGHIPGTEVTGRSAGRQPDWPDQIDQVVYFDSFGNAMTGIPADALEATAALEINGATVRRGRTFADVPPGGVFWYTNSQGLIEVAVNQGSAQDDLKLRVGTPITVQIEKE